MFEICQSCQETQLFEFQHDFGKFCSTTFSVTKSKSDFVKHFVVQKLFCFLRS